VTVLVPKAVADALGPVEGADVVVVAGGLAAAVRAAAGPVVVWSEGLAAGEEAEVAAAVRSLGADCIEVRPERWDGESPSGLSAACRGVISGFGVNGVRAAVAVLTEG
jgi:3-dehydroquinate dehydratase